jgi:hypothetical protein
LEKQNQVPKFEPPDEIPIEMRIKVPIEMRIKVHISAFGKTNSGSYPTDEVPIEMLFEVPISSFPHQGVSHTRLQFSSAQILRTDLVGSKIVVVVVVSQSSLLISFLFVFCDCVGDAAVVGAPGMCVVRWGRGSEKGSLVIHKLALCGDGCLYTEWNPKLFS